MTIEMAYQPLDDRSQFFAQSADLLCVAGLDGAFQQINPRWQQRFGWPESALIGLGWLDFVDPRDRAIVTDSVQAITSGKSNVQFVHRFRCAEGLQRWLAWHPILSADRQQIFAVVHDVTRQIQVEQALRADKARPERAIRGTKEGLWEWSLATDDTYLSPRFKELLGFDLDELPNHKDAFFMRLHPDDAERSQAAIDRHFIDRTPYEIDVRLLTKSGVYRWYQSRGLAEWDQDGPPIRLTGCLSDITDRKLAEQRQRESEQRLSFALEATEFGDWSMDLATNILIRSPQHDRCFGYLEPPQWDYKIFIDHIHPDDQAMVHSEYVTAMKGKGYFDVEMRVIWPDRSVHWLWSKGRFYFDEKGALQRVAGGVVEITKKRLEEAALKETEGRYTLLFDNNLDGILQCTAEGDILASNPAACAIFRATPEQLARVTRQELVAPLDDRRTAFRAAVQRDGRARGTLLLRRLDGTLFEADVSCSRYQDHNKKTLLSLTFRDVTAQRQAEADIHRLAFYDPLTGLSNRRLLIDRMNQLLLSARRTALISSVFFIDLDYFKNVNDAKGHAVGDILLKLVADRLSNLMREGDTVSRIGGDEFVVLATNLSNRLDEGTHYALAIAEKIRAALCEPFYIEQLPYVLGCSIGITFLPKNEESASDLLREADTAMYRAKEAGRNRVECFRPVMHDDAVEHLMLKNDLSNALSRNEIAMHIQPQVDQSGKTVGAELLMRWMHPTRGNISPAVFIPLAEESGMILSLGEWALDQGCELIVRLANEGRPIPISINISPRQFRQSRFSERVFEVLEKTGAAAGSLILELTEGLLIENIDATITMMQSLAAAGVRFSIDDFGTGYSSLAYIRRLPLHEIKIDRSFVKSVPNDADETAIVQTIIAMAKNLDLKVVAEGVETARQADFLIESGCDAMQGYYFARPMPIAVWLEQ